MLNEQDQKFVANAFQDVRKILIASTGSIEKAEECLSYLTDVYLEYDPEKFSNFPTWAAQRCTMRLKDEERHNIGATRYNNYFKAKKLKEEMIKSTYDSLEYQEAEKKLQDMNPLDRFFGNCSIEGMGGIEMEDFKNSYATVEWNDLKESIQRRLEKDFPESKGCRSKTKKNMLYKTIIMEYILPKCEGIKHITLEAIAQRSGVCIATVTNAKNHTAIKNFFRKVLELDGD